MTDKIPLKEAMELLTLGEIKAIEKHEGIRWGDAESASGLVLLGALVWAFERRNDLKENKTLTTWADVDKWTSKALDEYFDADEIEIDPTEPETDSGKEV